MAIMIPAEPPGPGPGREAERILWEVLKKGLDDEHFVYHGLTYFEPEAARDGEADFVIVHRERGLLVVECKGRGVWVDGHGRWWRGGGGAGAGGEGERLKMSPFDQAERHVHDLIRQLEQRLEQAYPGSCADRFPFIHGHGVALPRTELGATNLPLSVAREKLLDAADLSDIGGWLDRLYALWRRRAGAAARGLQPLSKGLFRSFRKNILHPRFRLVECLGAQLKGDDVTFARMTEEQQRTVEGVYLNPQLKVQGGAGTGKTALALEAARHFATEGQRVLLMCFNSFLGDDFEARVEGWELPGDRITATTFHRLCHQAYEVLGLPLEVPTGAEATQEFWDVEAPLVLLDALEQGALGPWDAIVVDEGQDFLASWWDILGSAYASDETSKRRLLAFYDPSQNIFGRPDATPAVPLFRLNLNCRNTRRIAEVVHGLGGVEARSHPNCPEGEAPSVRPQASPAKTQKTLDGLLRKLTGPERLLPDQITLLTPHSRKNSCLAGLDELGGHALASDPGDRDQALLHCSIGAFKGLEADVVILCDIDPADDRCGLAARYVAASRARHRLYVFAKGDWLAES